MQDTPGPEANLEYRLSKLESRVSALESQQDRPSSTHVYIGRGFSSDVQPDPIGNARSSMHQALASIGPSMRRNRAPLAFGGAGALLVMALQLAVEWLRSQH